MVSSTSIFFMCFSILISVIVPLGMLIFIRRKYQASLLSFFVGIVAWIVAVQILEAPVHYYLLVANETTAAFLQQPIAYMLYGGLMAGIFEETARLICFKFILRKQTRIQDGLSYGIGHGGGEAIILVGLTYVNNLVLAAMINSGTLATLGLPTDMLAIVEQQLIQTAPAMFGIAGLERLFAMIVHVGLSLLVFKAVKEGKWQFYILAILLHAFLNFPAALAQIGILNYFTVEVFIGLYALAFLIYILKAIKDSRHDLTEVEDKELVKYQRERY